MKGDGNCPDFHEIPLVSDGAARLDVSHSDSQLLD
jgi:hypothetical protein